MVIPNKKLSKMIIPILKKHGVTQAGLFGSIVRGTMGEGSDVDILIEFPTEKTLLDLVALKLELEELLNAQVDLVEYLAIDPRLKKSILEEQVSIL